MPVNLRNRSFLKELDFTPGELGFLLDLSLQLKKARYAGTEQQRLRGNGRCRHTAPLGCRSCCRA